MVLGGMGREINWLLNTVRTFLFVAPQRTGLGCVVLPGFDKLTVFLWFTPL